MDPHEHIYKYQQVMLGTSMSKESRDVILWILFPQRFKGNAIKWFYQLGVSLVASFKELTKAFLESYFVNIYIGTTHEELFSTVQVPDESLPSFDKWFSKVVAEIPNYNDVDTLLALRGV